MPDYEVLELLLYQAIPRRNVKPIAKDILDRFGSLGAALCAPVEALQQQVERRQQQHGQGHTVLLGQLTQLPAQDIVETLLDEAGTTSTLASRVDQGVWQLKRRMFLPKVCAPPLQQSCARSTVQYLLLSGGDIDVLMAQLR